MLSKRQVVALGLVASSSAIVAAWVLRKRSRGDESNREAVVRNSKVYLIRHGESTVNARGLELKVQGDTRPERAYHEPEFFDAALTERGRQGAVADVQEAISNSCGCQRGRKVMVLSSTLSRALETATLGVGSLFPANSSNSWIALECIREATTCEVRTINDQDLPMNVDEEKPCNMRRPLSFARKEYPHVDFGLCPEQDPLPQVETVAMVDARVLEFVKWLQSWIECGINGCDSHCTDGLDIVVVTHYVFLHRLMTRLEAVTEETVATKGFKNNEVRAVPLGALLSIG